MRTALSTSAATTVLAAAPSVAAPVAKPRQLRLWVCGDAHVGTDHRRERESLAEAIRQSEADDGLGFEWDLALNLGDFSGNQGPPKDDEGREVVKQYGALRKHRREDFYDLAGNHDATVPGEETQWWFRKWIDPTGEQTRFSGMDNARRRHAVSGTWERYSFQVGNLLFLMMSDRNDVGPPVGRGKTGGYPAGMVTSATFDWWKGQVAGHPDRIIVSAHHHMLKETTVASGPWEGFVKDAQGSWRSHYHGYFPQGGPMGASYLYWLDDQPDAQAFEKHLAAHPNAIDFWLGGHTYTHPDDRKGGRSHIERRWEVSFLNCCALSRHHANKTTLPMSRRLTFTEGSAEVRVQCYLHTSQHAPRGWYAKAERTLSMSKPFRLG